MALDGGKLNVTRTAMVIHGYNVMIRDDRRCRFKVIVLTIYAARNKTITIDAQPVRSATDDNPSAHIADTTLNCLDRRLSSERRAQENVVIVDAAMGRHPIDR
jgi:hypothetical protein